jgi:hypothetical protein
VPPDSIHTGKLLFRQSVALSAHGPPPGQVWDVHFGGTTSRKGKRKSDTGHTVPRALNTSICRNPSNAHSRNGRRLLPERLPGFGLRTLRNSGSWRSPAKDYTL